MALSAAAERCVYTALTNPVAARELVSRINANSIDVGETAAVVNEAGADTDFRIETDANANAFFLDAGLFTGVGAIGIGSAAVNTAALTVDPPATAAVATVSYSKLRLNNTAAVTVPAGTTALVASLHVDEPNITATGTVTNAATVYIEAAPTEGGTGNYALWVDAGASRFDGSVICDAIVENTTSTGVTIDGVLVKDTGVFNADLTLSSTNEINIQIGTVSLLAIDDAAITANTGAAATAGKAVFVETQDGGTAAADAVGLAGASLTITAGLGTAGGAHTSNNPAGGASGCISLVAQAGGAAGSGGSGAAGTNGIIRLNGLTVTKQAAPATATTAATLTAAQLLNGIIVATPTAGATAYTVPLGSLLDAALHADVGADEGFEWSIINLGADADDIITVTTDTGHTLVGIMAVASSHSSTGLTYGSSARFFTRRTAADVFVTYRIS